MTTYDALVVGAGPAGMAMAASLSDLGLATAVLAPDGPATTWPNTYGIWQDDLELLGLGFVLGHVWRDCVVYAGAERLPLGRTYGLIDNARLRGHLWDRCEQGGVIWHTDSAVAIAHHARHATVTTGSGAALDARVIIDAGGHRPAFVQRPEQVSVAFQAAYGIVGAFDAPPVESEQLVFMDYRSEHLSPAERAGAPTFLYAMDLGNGEFFVEETSLAHSPAVSFDVLEQRLHRRLAHRGVHVRSVRHVEHCLFPMNLALPHLDQPVMGFGGAASMVHPASGFQVGAALKRAPQVAAAIAAELGRPGSSPVTAARAGWQALWPPERVRRRMLYLFGLENLLRFDEADLNAFFAAFFHLPKAQWAGYLSDTLTTRQVMQTMLRLFLQAPKDVKWALAAGARRRPGLLWQVLRGTQTETS